MTHTFWPPLRSDVKTMREPSGEKRGCASKAMPEVSWVASPPVIGTVKRFPRWSKTIVVPSGLTSSEIHEPTVMSIASVRSTGRGRAVSSSPSDSWARMPVGTRSAAARRRVRMIVQLP